MKVTIEEKEVCPQCNGNKYWFGDGLFAPVMMFPCGVCDETGFVDKYFRMCDLTKIS